MSRSKTLSLLVICGLLLISLLAPSSAAATLPPPVSPSIEVSADAINVTWRAPTTSNGTLQLTGCDSTRVFLNATREEFAVEYPTITILLTGGGNNVAFSEWITGRSDVAMASRQINGTERQQAADAGLNVTETKVAVESVAVVVSPDAGVTTLTAEQLQRLFAGDATNWDQVGGVDLAVTPFVPAGLEPPRLYFNSSIMGGRPFAPSAQYENDSLAIADRVANASGGVGIVRSGFLDRMSGVVPVNISADGASPPVPPSDREAAYNDTYRLAREFYLYTDGAPSGALGMWVDYVLSEDRGQRVAAENGFLPLNTTDLNASRAGIANTSDIEVIGYKVHRLGPDDSTVVTAVQSTAYVDRNVTAGANYSYSVSAVYATGEGERSSPMEASIPSAVSPPGNGTATPARSNFPGTDLAIVGGAVAAVALGAVAVIVYQRKRK